MLDTSSRIILESARRNLIAVESKPAADGRWSLFAASAAVLLASVLLLASCAHRGGEAVASDAGRGAAATGATAEVWQPRGIGGADCARTESYDAVIVGAGLAGLTAARELRHLGRSVLILEATERIGGRGFVGQVSAGAEGEASVPIDYGGAWIHGVPTNPLTSLVDAMGFERVRSELDAPYYVDGERAGDAELERFYEAYEAYESAVSEAATRIMHEKAIAERVCEASEEAAAGGLEPGALCAEIDHELGDDKSAAALCERAQMVEEGALAPNSFCGEVERTVRITSDVAAQYLPSGAELGDVVDLVAATAGPLETATELETSSAVDAAGFAAGEDDLLDRGMGAFVKAYGEGIPVCLATPVTRLELRSDGVTVHAAERKYEARFALVTVSVGVLRAGKITFEPPLPDWKLEAIERLRMGNMQKVIIPFERDIFGDELPNSWVLVASDQGPARRVMAFVIKPLGANIAIGFYGGEEARRFEAQCVGIEHTSGLRSPSGCDDPAIAAAVAALAGIYGADAVQAAIRADQIHVTRWSLEPYTLGAYSVPLPGAWDQRQALGRPVAASEGGPARLFFAGEASSRTIFNGSFAGAFETGLQAAREINAEMLNAVAR